MKKIFSFVFLFCLVLAAPAYSATMVDIYGPGQNIVNLSMAKPLTAPNVEAKGLGVDLDSKIRYNLSYLPFMNLVPDVNILGGTVLSAWSGANLDFRRFQNFAFLKHFQVNLFLAMPIIISPTKKQKQLRINSALI